MKARALLNKGIEQLKAAGISESREDAWELFSFVTDMNRACYYAHSEEDIPGDKCGRFQEFIRLRSEHIPIQRLTGVREFMGLEFLVRDCLIPRQETEILVEEVLNYIREHNLAEVELLDLCTGTGCIPISIIKGAGARVRAMALDISREAIRTAEMNRERHGLTRNELEFEISDLFQNISVSKKKSFDIITSNPPYIPTEVISTLTEEVKTHDPYIALDGGEDGLFFYRRIIPKARDYLKKGGLLILEIGFDQGQAITDLMKLNGYANVRIINDLAGLNRIVTGTI